MNTIGIPKALTYYFYPESYKTFFKELGFQVLVSESSTKRTLTLGNKLAINDNCLPVKLYFGHIKSLLDKNPNYLFIPRFISLRKSEYMCPKFIGIPDLVNHTFPTSNTQILSPVINYNERKDLWKAVNHICEYFNIPTSKCITAYSKSRLIYSKQLQKQKNDFNYFRKNPSKVKIALLGHDYILEDKLLGEPIKNKLKALNCEIISSNCLQWLSSDKTKKHIKKPLYWTKNKLLFSSAVYLTRKELIDGIIQLNTFPCGPDSVVSCLIEKKINQISSIPCMTLTLDEHTGMAGIQTRLEAFIDLIARRKAV